MKKLSLLLLCTLICTSCSFGTNSTPTPQSGDPSTPQRPATVSYTETLDSTSEKIKKSDEFNQCMDMNVNMCVNMAGTQIAQKTQSLEFCDELGTPDQKESCKFGIVINKSQAEKNISLCDKLGDTYKSRCKSEYYKSEAVRLKDPKLCENIGKTVSGEANPEDSRDRDQCAMSIVLSNPDTTAEDCKSIKDENIRELCTVNVTRMKERALPPQQ